MTSLTGKIRASYFAGQAPYLCKQYSIENVFLWNRHRPLISGLGECHDWRSVERIYRRRKKEVERQNK